MGKSHRGIWIKSMFAAGQSQGGCADSLCKCQEADIPLLTLKCTAHVLNHMTSEHCNNQAVTVRNAMKTRQACISNQIILQSNFHWSCFFPYQLILIGQTYCLRLIVNTIMLNGVTYGVVDIELLDYHRSYASPSVVL